MDADALLASAGDSKWRLLFTNWVLHRFIPFNKPHGLMVKTITKDKAEVTIPYKRKNLNHLKGIHACCLATASEYSSGLLLLRKLGTKEYRIIMESMEVKYHYQAKMAAIATFEISDQEVKENISDVLLKEDAAFVRCEIKVHDTVGNHISTAYTNWQIKNWKKVKTKVD